MSRTAPAPLPYRPIVLAIYGLVGTITAISLHLSQGKVDEAVREIARERGAVLFRLIEQTREWNARHGGVYVPVDPATRPNPYLHHPKRDITDQEGRALTMVNPAFMTRQIAEIAEKAEGIRFHITSLNPIRPANRADAWETRALKSFEQRGLDEKLDYFPEGGGIFKGPTHRYMAPLHVKPACLQCHAAQGYRVGDIRGGISISMPAEKLIALSRQRRLQEFWQHLFGGFVVAGLGHLLAWRSRRSYLALRDVNQRQEAIIGERTRDLSAANAALERDIAERRRAEAELEAYREQLEALVAKRTAALREAETRYRMVADFTYDWETWIDPEERWIYCSPSSERITGHTAREFMDDPGLILDIVHPDDRAKMAEHLHEAHRAAGGFNVFSFRIVRPDGSLVWLEHACQPVFDETGRHLGQRASNRDITERMQAAATLSIAKEAAEAANRAKSAFLANMSHELRTPLNAILGFAQILEGDPRLPADARHNLATINRSGRHLLTLINDVLDLSRIEAGRAQLLTEVFELPDTLLAVEEMIRIRAEAKGLEFAVVHPEDLPTHVVGDAHRLRQVLINLLGNAVKYTDQGRVSLTTRVLPQERIQFEVCDTGPGISVEDQERIFQAFYQTEAGSAKGEGTGLGLAISREFVRLMGGELTLTSTPGQGSCFRFAVPLPASDRPPHDGLGARIAGLAPGQIAPRILVAEDNPDNQQVVRHLLTRLDCEPRIARNGREAVQLFQSWRPQLILMDMRMPEMDGYAATRAIRALPGGETLPIVALTASAFEEDRDKVLAAGCNEMVRKPIEETRFYEVIGNLLGLAFRYAESSGETAPAAGDLSTLPAATRAELAEAAVALDTEAILDLITRLRASYPDEANLIAELLEGYRFDQLLERCGNG